MKSLFPGDTYDTPPATPRYWGDRLFLGMRWYFFFRYLRIVWSANRLARQGKFDDEQWVIHSHYIFKNIEHCGGRYHLTGLDNLRPSSRALVFVSNHMSTLETMIFPCILQPEKPIVFVVKKALVDMPLFGAIMRSRDPILVGRQNPREDFKNVLEQGKQAIERGRSVVIFPQRTRHPIFIPEQFNTLGIKLALRAGVPILPIAIKTDFWGNGKIVKELGPIHRRRPIHMAFGSPMAVTGNGKEEHEQIVDFIQSHLRIWEKSD